MKSKNIKQRVPDFYNPSNVGKVVPNEIIGRNSQIAEYARDYREDFAVSPAADKSNIFLLLVDIQPDFIYPNGALGVPGAVEDTRRLIEWGYQNLHRIDHICASMDTHYPIHVSHPDFWIDKTTNRPPAPFTTISAAEYLHRYEDMFVPFWDSGSWIEGYLKELEKNGKKQLMVWPLHTLKGTFGGSLEPNVSDFILFHSVARQVNATIHSKGDVDPEMYSILEAECPLPHDVRTQRNIPLLSHMSSYEKICIAGQAKSHCVYETVKSIVVWAKSNAPQILSKIYLMMDCMSSVDGSAIGVDFDGLAQRQYEKWASDYGLNLVTTQDSF